jgi:hypothetical protein
LVLRRVCIVAVFTQLPVSVVASCFSNCIRALLVTADHVLRANEELVCLLSLESLLVHLVDLESRHY